MADTENHIAEADSAGRFEELLRVSERDGIPIEFAAHYRRILSARNERVAMMHTITTLLETLHPSTLTVTKRDKLGRFLVIDNYLDGIPWEYRMGVEVPNYSLTDVIRRTGKTTFRDASLSERQETDDEWFLGRSLIGVPIKSFETGEVEGTIVIGFDEPEKLTETAATIANIAAAGYSAAVGNTLWLDEGVEIGRTIEQQRMVQRLHDTAVQEVFACECAAQSIAARYENVEGLSEHLDGLLALLHDANRDLRQVLADTSTHSTTSEWVTVAAIVDEVSATHQHSGGCPITLMEQRTLEVSASIGDVVQSVLRETLANVRKHAAARNVVISYGALSDDVFFLNVEDDGCGFTPRVIDENESQPLHFGISNMNNMVRRAGGTFTIASTPQEGTSVRVRIPMRVEGVIYE